MLEQSQTSGSDVLGQNYAASEYLSQYCPHTMVRAPTAREDTDFHFVMANFYSKDVPADK